MQTADVVRVSKRARAIILFLGVWLIGTGFALLFTRHAHNPFDAFTSAVPATVVPVVVGVYAAGLAGVWAALPRSRSEFINEAIGTGMTVVGGVLAPHALSFVFGLFR